MAWSACSADARRSGVGPLLVEYSRTERARPPRPGTERREFAGDEGRARRPAPSHSPLNPVLPRGVTMTEVSESAIEGWNAAVRAAGDRLAEDLRAAMQLPVASWHAAIAERFAAWAWDAATELLCALQGEPVDAALKSAAAPESTMGRP